MNRILILVFWCFGVLAFGQVQPYEIEAASAANNVLLSQASPLGEYDHTPLSSINLSSFNNDLPSSSYWTDGGIFLYSNEQRIQVNESAYQGYNFFLNGNMDVEFPANSGLRNLSIGQNLQALVSGTSLNFAFGNFNLSTAVSPSYNYAAGVNNGRYGTTMVGNFLNGDSNGRDALTLNYNYLNGQANGQEQSSIIYSMMNGYRNFRDNTSTSESSVSVGYLNGYQSSGRLKNSLVVGTANAYTYTSNLDNSLIVGIYNGYNSPNINNSIFVGQSNGRYNTGNLNNSIYLGFEQAYNSGTSDPYRLHIGMYRNTSLIYGEFDNELVTINGTLGYTTQGAAATSLVGQDATGKLTTTDVNDLVTDLNYWTLSGTDLSYNGGNVGIGVSSPSVELQVLGRISQNYPTLAYDNIVIGSSTTGASLTTGNVNVYIGDGAGAVGTTFSDNIGIGKDALGSATSSSNIAIGVNALENTTGNLNTAIGYNSMAANTSGIYGVGIGFETLKNNTTGQRNNAIGFRSQLTNITGSFNTSFGTEALYLNSSSSYNTALGYQALYDNTAASNTAIGAGAGRNVETGASNTYIGRRAAYSSTTGSNNVAIGYYSHYNASTGSQNVIIGRESGLQTTTGANNTMIGYRAGYLNNQYGSVLIGYTAGQNNSDFYRLFIDNSSTSTPLIYGEFDNDLITINGDFEVEQSGAVASTASIINGTNSWNLLNTGASGDLVIEPQTIDGDVIFRDQTNDEWFILDNTNKKVSIDEDDLVPTSETDMQIAAMQDNGTNREIVSIGIGDGLFYDSTTDEIASSLVAPLPGVFKDASLVVGAPTYEDYAEFTETIDLGANYSISGDVITVSEEGVYFFAIAFEPSVVAGTTLNRITLEINAADYLERDYDELAQTITMTGYLNLSASDTLKLSIQQFPNGGTATDIQFTIHRVGVTP